MEVDNPTPWKDSLECVSSDIGKFANMKSFVNAAREFEATHSEASIDLMNRSLRLISSSDISVFSSGRPEICAFFSALWRIMCDDRAPRWSAVAVLARAIIEPNMRHALTHTYKFLPVLSRLLSESISNEKKIKLLSVMQDISYGIKISWQESYLLGLMKQLTQWILQPMSEPQDRVIGHKSLTILVNVCYGNLSAIHVLMQTVDTKAFVVHLINLKDGGYGGVSVCRLLACVSSAVSRAPRPADVHGYIDCTMRTFNKAIIEKDCTQLLHAYTFMNDLCLDNTIKNFVLTYPNFSTLLKDALEEVEKICRTSSNSMKHADSIRSSWTHILKYLTVLMSLDLYSLRCHHNAVINVCLWTKDVCLSESLELFAVVISQYKDDSCLSSEAVHLANEFLTPVLDPRKAGLQWLQVVGALCEMTETQDKVLSGVTPESFEDILYSVLHYTSQNGVAGVEQSQQATILGCRVALTLAPLARPWDSALARMLAHHQVRKMLCTSLTGGVAARRRQVLHLIKHHYFPSDQMNQVFGETSNLSDSQLSLSQNGNPVCLETDAWCASPTLQPSQECAVDRLVEKLSDAIQNDKISDITTSSMMELFSYKIKCLEQRIYSQSVALKGATEHVATLEHTLAMSKAVAASQQDALYTIQVQNERYNKTLEDLHKQLEDAETTLRGFHAKLAAERLDRDNQITVAKQEARAQVARMDSEMKTREKEMQMRLEQAQVEIETVQNKLDQQTKKNSDLAGVLVKFEERVKQRDRRLEEAAAAEAAQRRDLEHRDATIKQLEKTVLERENRLYQVTTQLEEMKRVQEMVAKLMSKSTAGVNGGAS